MQLVDDYTSFGWTVFLGDKSGPTVVRAFRTWYASVKQLMGVHGEVGCVLTDNGTEWVNEGFRTMLLDLGLGRELTAVDGPKSNGRVERRIALVSEGAKAAFVELPKQFPDTIFPARTTSYAAIWPEAFTWMNDCLNLTAAVHKDDKRCPEEKLYGKRRVKQAWPFMMPGFRHRNRPTKMHDKGERCFYLNSGNDHSSNTHKVIPPAGIATYSAHCTFGYRRQAFQGEVPTWGEGAITSSRPWPSKAASTGATPDPLAAATSSCGGGFPAAIPAASAAPRGGGIPPIFSSGVAPTSLAAATSSRGGGFPAATPAASAAPRRRGIPPMFSSGAAPTSFAAATSSRGGGFPAATPAASAAPRGGGISPMFSSGAAPSSLAAATSSQRWFSRRDTGGFSSSAWGGAFLPCFHLVRRLLRWQRRHLDIFTRRGFSRRDTGGVSSFALGGHSSHVFIWSGAYFGSCGDIFPRRGYPRRGSNGDYFGGCGDIFPRRGYSRRGSSGDYFGGCGDIFPRWGYSRHGSSGGGYRWHTRKRERSRTAGGSGCAPTPPESDPSVAAGTATEELLATGQEQLVTSGGRREVLAEV